MARKRTNPSSTSRTTSNHRDSTGAITKATQRQNKRTAGPAANAASATPSGNVPRVEAQESLQPETIGTTHLWGEAEPSAHNRRGVTTPPMESVAALVSAPLQSTGAPTRAERPPPPPRRSAVGEAVSSAVSSLSGMSKDIMNCFSDGFRELSGSICNVGSQITTQLVAMREENSSYHKEIMEQLKGNATAILESGIRYTRVAADDQGDPGSVEQLIKKASAAQDYVKYATFIEFLDENKGESIFVEEDDDNDNPSAKLIVDAAKFVHGTADFGDFLVKEIPIEKKGKSSSTSVASLLTRAQGRAHENVRKNTVTAFWAACPLTSPLHPSARTTTEEKVRCARDFYQHGKHRLLEEYRNAWISACRTAKKDALSSAKTAEESLRRLYPDTAVPPLPTFPEDEVTVKLNYYSLGFVSMKITKALETLGNVKSGGMNKWHGPAWASETLYLWENRNFNESGYDSEDAEDLPMADISGSAKPVLLNCVVASGSLSSSDIARLEHLRG